MSANPARALSPDTKLAQELELGVLEAEKELEPGAPESRADIDRGGSTPETSEVQAEAGEGADRTSAIPGSDSSLALLPFVVVNPVSGNGKTRQRWPALMKELENTLGPAKAVFTSKQMDAVELTRKALLAGHRNVVAVGGDGTLNEVLNGFFDEDGELISPDASLSLIPCGTGGDFRRSAGVPTQWSEALRHLSQAEERRIDVGRVRFIDHQGKPAVRYFLNIASFGASGMVVEEVARRSKWLGGKLTFMLGSLRALSRYRDCRVKIQVDDGPEREAMVTTLAVCNGKFFGGGMKVSPDAEIDDGEFGFTLWSGYGISDFVLKSSAIYSGKHVDFDRTETFIGKKLVASSSERVLLDVDGEQPGMLPATFEILPGALLLKA